MRRFLWDDVVISRETAADVVTASEADFARRGFGLWGVHDRATRSLARVLRLPRRRQVPSPS